MRNQWPFLFVILFLFALSSNGYAQENKKAYYENGKIRSEMKYDEACTCFRWTLFYENGAIEQRSSMKNWKQVGESVSYYENGTVKRTCFFKDGIFEGRVFENYENGKLKLEEFYANGYKSGVWKYYEEDGSLSKEQGYETGMTPHDSKLNSMVEKRYYASKPACLITYKAGKLTETKILDKVAYDALVKRELPKGQVLYGEHCSSCHMADKVKVGPMLKGVTEVRSNEWLLQMIKNGEALRLSGDPVAKRLYEEYYGMEHPSFEQLNKEELQSIVDYLKTFK